MKSIYKKIFIAASFVTLFSCSDYLDVNQDPNNPQIDQVNPEIVFPGAQLSTARTYLTTMNQLGNLMAVNWGGNVVQFQTPFNNEFNYNITSTFYTGIWDNLYLRTANFTNIINYDDDNYDNHKAASYILRAFYTQYLVDLYGDIPYSERHQLGNNLFPKYDDDQAVYRALIAELDTAIDLIENASNEHPLASDIMFGGDMSQWTKFANTIKLRILMREAVKAETDAASQTYLTEQFAALDLNFVDADVTMNPGYLNQDDKQNPFYAAFGFLPNGDPTNNNQAIVATKHAIQFLDGTLTGVADGRLGRIYRLSSSGNYYGVEQGALLASLPSGQTLSRLGEGLKVDSPSDASASSDSYIMTLAESLFLQAEAVQRGYISVGNAKDLFQDGIRASFALLGASDVENYIVNSDNVAQIGWDGTANKIEAIMTQKWIALNGFNGIESWIEITRTGFPVLPLPINRTERPIRLLYPQSEISGNSANVPSQTTASAFNSRIFWDVN